MNENKSKNFGLLIFRVGIGSMILINHGMGRLTQIGTVEATRYLSLFGLSPQFSHFMIACIESLGALFLIFGIFTHFSALVLTTMLIAVFFGHTTNIYLPGKFLPEGELFIWIKENTLLYLIACISLALTGAGRYSIDENNRHRLPIFFKLGRKKINSDKLKDFGLLFLRVFFGAMMFTNFGLPKLLQIGTDFANYFSLLGLSPQISHSATAYIEGIGALFLIFGIFTRFSAMAIVAIIIASFIGLATSKSIPIDEYLIQYKEYTYLFITVFISLIFTGAGRYSVDEKLKYRLTFLKSILAKS